MDIQNGFMFFRSYWEAAQMLESDSERAAYILGICQYAFSGDIPDLKGTPAAMFALTKPNIDKSRSRAAAGSVKKNGENRTKSKRDQTKSKKEQNATDKGEGSGKDKRKYVSPSTGNKFNNFENGSYMDVEDLEKKLVQ